MRQIFGHPYLANNGSNYYFPGPKKSLREEKTLLKAFSNHIRTMSFRTRDFIPSDYRPPSSDIRSSGSSSSFSSSVIWNFYARRPNRVNFSKCEQAIREYDLYPERFKRDKNFFHSHETRPCYWLHGRADASRTLRRKKTVTTIDRRN